MIWIDEGGPPLRPLGLALGETALAVGAVAQRPGELYAEELRSIDRAVAGRRAEFATARALARRAMAALGHPGGVIGRGEDRAPVWPAGVVGSLSHCRHYAAAVVSRGVPALGVDVECLHRLSDRTHPAIFTAAERSKLAGDPEATSVFSAKEAVFKAIHPMTRTPAGFHDAEIELDLAAGRFKVRYVGAEGPNRRMGDLHGAVACAGGHVLTVAWLDPD